MGRNRSTGEPISSEGCWVQGEGEGLQLTWDPGANLVATTLASSLQRPPGASLGTWRTEKESTLDETYSGIQPSCPMESKFKNCIDKLLQRSLYSMYAFPKFLILASTNPQTQRCGVLHRGTKLMGRSLVRNGSSIKTKQSIPSKESFILNILERVEKRIFVLAKIYLKAQSAFFFSSIIKD